MQWHTPGFPDFFAVTRNSELGTPNSTIGEAQPGDNQEACFIICCGCQRTYLNDRIPNFNAVVIRIHHQIVIQDLMNGGTYILQVELGN